MNPCLGINDFSIQSYCRAESRCSTLSDAALYITKLPKAEHDAEEWLTAAEVLMLIGERGGDPMMARIAMMQALHRQKPRATPASRLKQAKQSRIVR
jgi:hypothetical protein